MQALFVMICPRCSREIADGMYCIGCGYLPDYPRNDWGWE